MIFFFLEFEWDHCGFDQYHVDRHGTQSTHCSNILFHYCAIHIAGLFRYIFCPAIKCKFKFDSFDYIFHTKNMIKSLNGNHFNTCNYFITEILSLPWTSLLQSCARKEKVRSPITCHSFFTVLANLSSMLPTMPQRLFDIFCNFNSVPFSVFRYDVWFKTM